MDQKDIIFKIHRDINNDLKEILYWIKKYNNGDENQFDYVTSPALANAIDKTELLIDEIRKIVYQQY